MMPLPIQLAPRPEESVHSFVLRLLRENGATATEAQKAVQEDSRRRIGDLDARPFAEWSGQPCTWFELRLPKRVRSDRWFEIELFGTRWRDDLLLRGTRQQICPLCIEAAGVGRLEWDLLMYCACHVHGTMLVDMCHACGSSIQACRPALEMCRCGAYLTDTPRSTAAAPEVTAWCAMLSSKLAYHLGGAVADVPLTLAPFRGLSLDGATRLVQAFAGGKRAYRGAVLDATTTWLNSAAVHVLVQEGLSSLARLEIWGRVDGSAAVASALAEQTVRGVSQRDRSAAALALRHVAARPTWRNIRSQLHRQEELFEDPP